MTHKYNVIISICLIISFCLSYSSLSYADAKVSNAEESQEITFFKDPVFLSKLDTPSHPLASLVSLAQKDDARAQYMLGDLYSKGKGGFPQDIKKGYNLFEQSAKNGNKHAFIRLAALSKKQKNIREAYKWYSLAISIFPRDDTRKHIIRTRNQFAKTNKLTRKDIKKAKKLKKTWLKISLEDIKNKLTDDKDATKQVEKSSKTPEKDS